MGLLYLLRYYASHVSSMLVHNQPLIFFSNTFEFNMCHAFKIGALSLLYRYHIHILPFLPPHSSHISKEPMGSPFFCIHVGGCSGRMLGIHLRGFFNGESESCVENDCNLFQCSHQPFHSGGNHHSHDKRHSYFHRRNMAFIP